MVLNMLGEELLDWMAVLDCKHVVMLHPQMPASMGDPACLRRVGTTMTCEHCTAEAARASAEWPYSHRRPYQVTRTVLSAGLWDWTVWERYRDERWREQHLRSLAHTMGWCACEPERERDKQDA
jgi:hypothetical protein